MGNICIKPGQAGYDSDLNSSSAAAPTHQSGPRSNAPPATNAISINDISSPDREFFLNYNDPVRSLGLTSETKVYRTVASKYIKNGMLQGHHDASASIYNHERLVPNPYAAMRSSAGTRPPLYKPLKMRASELSEPVVNVMTGADAVSGAKAYLGRGKVTVEMTLGDFTAQGGKVYNDASSVNDSDLSAALILTLPSGCSVPVKIVE